MLYFYLFTPFLGLIKNYIKYKRLNFFIFCRTPLIYFFLHKFFNNIFQIIIIERWLLFIYKIIRSYIRDDYIRNKYKYQLKYGLIYN